MPPKTAKAIELPSNFKHLSEEEKLHFYILNSDEEVNLENLVKETPDFDFHALNIEIIPEEIEDPNGEDGATILPHPVETLLQACVRVGGRINCFTWLLANGADPSIYPPNQPTLYNLIADSPECQQYLEVLKSFWGNTLESTSNQEVDEDEDMNEKPQWNRESFIPTLNMPHPAHGKTPILVALKRKDQISTSILLELGSQLNVNTSDLFDNGSSSEPLFHYAVRISDVSLVECLWNSGISPFIRDGKRRTILHIAVENNRKEMIELLLKKMVKVPEDFANAEDVNGLTIGDLCVEKDNIELLKLLTTKVGVDINHVSSKDGMQCIHRAALNGKQNILEQLITTFKVKPSDVDSLGNTALHYASSRCDAAMVKFLIDKKAELGITNHLDGSLPIHFASLHGSVDVMQLFLNDKKLELNVQTKKKETPLHIAASQGYTELVSLLLERKDISIELENHEGYTPFEAAINAGHVKVAVLLLEKGAQIDRKHKPCIGSEETITHPEFSFTTLFNFIVARQYTPVVEAMIRSGRVTAEMINTTDSLGRSPFYVASESNIDIATLLLEHQDIDINLAEHEHGFSPLINCSRLGLSDAVKLILDREGAINQTCKDGKTALHYAATTDSMETIELLVRGGARVDAVDIRHRTPLYDACSCNNAAAVGVLIENGASLEFEDESGSRPLHYAVQHGSAEVVEVLCQAGCSLNSKDANGRTPLIVASQYKSSNCTPILARHSKQRRQLTDF